MMRQNNGSAGSGAAGDMMNLLESTDSDVEWLSLPPIKGKKPKKKRPYKAPSSSGGSQTCSLWTMAKIFLVLVLAACVVVLTIITYWLAAQVSELQEKVKKVESHNEASVGDVSKLFGQLQEVNKTLQNFRSGGQSLDQAFKNLTSVESKVSTLGVEVNKLSDGLKNAPELKQIPAKLIAVSKSVADIGSDVSGMVDQMAAFDKFMKSAQTQLETFELRISSLEGKDNDGKTMPPDVAFTLQSLPQQLATMNASIQSQLSVLQTGVGLQEAHFTLLDNVTENLRKNLTKIEASQRATSGGSEDLSSDEFKSKVEDIVNSMLIAGPGMSHEGSDEILEQLQTKLTNLSATVTALQEDNQKITLKPGANADDLLELLDGFETKFKKLNSTVVQLSSEVNNLATLFEVQTAQLTNVSSDVGGLKRYVVMLDSKIAGKDTDLVTPTAEKSSAPTVSSSVSMSITQNGNGTSSTSPPEGEDKPSPRVPGMEVPPDTGTTGLSGATVTLKPAEHLKLEDIDSAEALRVGFSRWDKYGDGQVTYATLTNHFKESTMPPESAFKPFDKDGNGLYSMEEIAEALGIDLGDEP